ncbi:MAG: TnsD family Tn7-like transposition protein [Candidatus Cyclobacteriaceae bacterium M2_1C_046]
MLNYWSFPFEDEILYSLIGRNISYLSNGGPKQHLANFFGTKNISATLDLPSGISFLSEQLKEVGYSSKKVILDHTLYPYYFHFLSSDKKEKVLKSMQFKSGDIHTLCGINAGIHPCLRTPRFCKKCFEEDLYIGRPVYFRRAHQIPSVKICIKHNCYLLNTALSPSNINKHSFINPDPSLLNQSTNFYRENANEQIFHISKKLVSLLNNTVKNPYDGSQYFYNQKIKDLGFEKGLSSLQINEIYERWNQYFDSETLNHFNTNVELSEDSCWLKAIFRKHRKSFDPSRHILVQDFISSLDRNFISKQVRIADISHNCRNPVCDHYLTYKHTLIKKNYDPKTKRIISHVTCKCQYAYTQSYIRSKDKLFIRVKEFGDIWHKKLMELNSDGQGLRKMASRLNSDPKTIKKILESKKGKPEKDKPKITVLRSKKIKWQELINKNQQKSVTKLRKKEPGLYNFLYRNCKEWLLKQSYPKKKRKAKSKVDWSQRDIDLVKKCQNAISDLKRESPRRRVTRSLILNILGLDSMYRNNMYKLPRFKSFLDSNSETKHQHRLRRLAIAAKELKKTGQPLSYWALLRQANIRKEYISDSIHNLVLYYSGEEIDFNYKIDKIA